MSKTVKIALIIGVVIIVGGCLLVGLIGVIGGGGAYYFFSKEGKEISNPTDETGEVVIIESGEEPVEISYSTEETGEAGEIPDEPDEQNEQDEQESNEDIKSLYIGTGEPDFPGGVRLCDPKNTSDYQDFTDGEVYNFAKKLFKNARWEIYKDGTFNFIPGAEMPRNDLYPLSGTGYETGKMVALTNYTVDGSGGDSKNSFDIAGNISLEFEKPQLQLVLQYTFKADDELNFGLEKGKKGKTHNYSNAGVR